MVRYLCRCHFAFHKIHIFIDVFMVKLFNHVIVYNYLKLFQVNQVAGCVAYFSFNGYKQL
jgi:hypothetical protein